MTAITHPTNATLDRFAIGLSGLCVAHCVVSAVALTTLSSVAAALAAPWIHEAGFAVAMLLGAVALVLGVMRHGHLLPVAVGFLGLGVMAGALTLSHGAGETAYTLFGVTILAFGHYLNVVAAR